MAAARCSALTISVRETGPVSSLLHCQFSVTQFCSQGRREQNILCGLGKPGKRLLENKNLDIFWPFSSIFNSFSERNLKDFNP